MKTYVPPEGWTIQTITVPEAELPGLCDSVVDKGFVLLNVVHDADDKATVSVAVPKDEWLNELLED